MNAVKIFGIGLNKTGTRSIAEATRILGFRTLHKGDAATSAAVEAAIRDGNPPLAYIGEKFNAYFDVEAVVHNFIELDEWYPGSKFILTTRHVEGWILSRTKHVHANQARAARGEYNGTWLTVDVDAWRTEWDRHHRAVRAYFALRPDDLLEFDVTAGSGWETIAPFLGRSIPNRPFPWENKEGSGTYRPEGWLRRWQRRRRGAVARLSRR